MATAVHHHPPTEARWEGKPLCRLVTRGGIASMNLASEAGCMKSLNSPAKRGPSKPQTQHLTIPRQCHTEGVSSINDRP